MPFLSHLSIRRAAPAALVAGLLLSILPAVTFADEPPPEAVLATEWDVLQAVNEVRGNHGLAPLRMAGDVREVARDRSRSMKRLNYFGHVSPSGQDAGDLLGSRRIGYRMWGEVIGWTRYIELKPGTKWMVDWWKRSPVHREIMLSRQFNYAGVGVAQDGSLTLWTIVFVNQADHTAPVASVRQPRTADTFAPTAGLTANQTGAVGAVRTSADSRVTVRWWGRDRRLSTRTAGLHSFALQHRVPGEGWRIVRTRTTDRKATFDLRPGMHAFRVRARDRVGNLGGWSTAARILVR
jgi:uncharacterized protein YkwD